MTFPQILDLGTGGIVVFAILTIVFGLLNCFFGYRVFRFMLVLWGLGLGAYAGAVVASNLSGGELLWIILGGILGALIGAALMSLLYFVGVFVVGAAAGYALAQAIGVAAGIDIPDLVVIIVAVVVGIIALILQRVVLILATALTGSSMVIEGVLALVTGRAVDLTHLFSQPTQTGEPIAGVPQLLLVIVWLVLALVGAVTQFAMTRTPATAPPLPPAPRDRW